MGRRPDADGEVERDRIPIGDDPVRRGIPGDYVVGIPVAGRGEGEDQIDRLDEDVRAARVANIDPDGRLQLIEEDRIVGGDDRLDHRVPGSRERFPAARRPGRRRLIGGQRRRAAEQTRREDQH